MEPQITLAIVDDHPTFRKGLILLLNSLKKYKVIIEASEGAELLEKLSKMEELPAICLLDISMPNGMNGYDTFAHLRKSFPTIAIVFFSLYYLDDIMQHIEDSKSVFCLSKNAEVEDLDRSLQDIHEYWSTIDKNKINNPKVLKDMPTNKEMEILKYCCSGYNTKEIATIMHIENSTVVTHFEHLFEKFHVKSRPTLVNAAYCAGILFPRKRVY